MRQHFRRGLIALSALTCLVVANAALAAIQRTFVASTGNDANACTLTAPCRSFATAITKTNAGGEVIVLDSAGYGPVTIAKSVSLIAPTGIYAGVTVLSGDGIVIDAPGINVVLRGLSINGQGGANGINLAQAARLRIENCVVSGMSQSGITDSANGAELVVLDTIVRDNLETGVFILADASIVLDRVRSERNQIDGFAMLSLNSGVTATITDSTFAFNGRHGINVGASIPSSVPRIVVDRSVVARNGAMGFVLDGTGATAAIGILTRNVFHLDGNGAGGIRSDGPLTSVRVSANTMGLGGSDFAQLNGSFFFSYRDNVGVGGTFGTISTVSGD